jgi:signal transduction histidine kinase
MEVPGLCNELFELFESADDSVALAQDIAAFFSRRYECSVCILQKTPLGNIRIDSEGVGNADRCLPGEKERYLSSHIPNLTFFMVFDSAAGCRKYRDAAEIAIRLLSEKARWEDEVYGTSGENALRVLGVNFHKLRNVMGGVSGLIQLSELEAGDNDELLRNFQEILKVIKDFDDTSKENMALYREGDLDIAPGTADCSVLIPEKIKKVQRGFTLSSIDLQAQVAPDIVLSCHPECITIMLDVLLSNSFDACLEKADARIRLFCGKEDGFFVMKMEDTGEGIPYALQRHVFKPFVSTKEKALGTGLLLLERYVEKLNGAIHMTSVPDKGTTIKIQLPL